MDLLDFGSTKLSNAELIQQCAMLLWLNKGDDHKALLEKVTQSRVIFELYNRISSQNATDALHQQCIMSIADYIKKNPRASEADLVKEVTKQVEAFRQLIQKV